MTSPAEPNAAPAAAGVIVHRLDPGNSRFTVQGFAGGMLSFLAHSPTFAVRDYTGELRFDPAAVTEVNIQVIVRADSLELLDRVKAADRADIENRMRDEVLEVGRYADVRLEGTGTPVGQLGPHHYRLRIDGRLLVHGLVNPLVADAELQVFNDGARLSGEFPLRLSAFHIRPVTALGGAIQLNDQLRVVFDFVAWRPGSAPEAR